MEPTSEKLIIEQLNSIRFYSEEVEFELANPRETSLWINKIATAEGKKIESISYIFCSDEYLHKINIEHLKHDTYTDIITFPYRDGADEYIESDIFISIDRVKENADIHKTEFLEELHRVIIHGVLHLCGYGDKTEEEAKLMRKKEDEALAARDY